MANHQNFLQTNKGFTLIEMMVVVGIIGVLSAISYPSLTGMVRKYNFRAAAYDVLMTVTQARGNAIRDNGSCRVEFDLAANTFKLINSDGSFVTHNFTSYGQGIKLINSGETTCGNANKNWAGEPISQGSLISFSGRGFGNSRSIFIENMNNDICFAISASGTGVIKLRQYNGATPYSGSNWSE